MTSYVSDTHGAPLAIACDGVIAAATGLDWDCWAWGLLGLDLSQRNQHVAKITEIVRRRQLLEVVALAFVAGPMAIALLLLPAALYVVPEKVDGEV